MYSVVLMMALSGGGEAVDFGHRGGCSGSVGCSGYGASGCTGGHHRGHGHARCHGSSGCSGSYGCTGSCHGGGLFGKHRHRCHGSSGCSGSSYGSVGCYGGGAGSVGCYGGGAGCSGGVIVAPGYGHPGMGGPEVPKVMPKEEKKKVSLAPATIVVSLPASATLTVDGAPTTSTSAQRTLVTPAIETDSTYVYTLVAQVNGQSQTQQIQVRGGEVSQAQFSFPQSIATR